MASTSSPTTPASRIALAWEWKKRQFQQWLNWRLVQMDSHTRIRLRWPWPMRKPWQHDAVDVASFGGGLGDELMCTPVFREMKRLNPACQITFHSRYPALFEGFPHVERIVPYVEADGGNRVSLTYGPKVPPLRPLVTVTGECAGVIVEGDQLEPAWFKPAPRIEAIMASLPHSRVVVQPLTSRWTPNKNWPLPLWQELITLLTSKFQVVEVGSEPAFPEHDFGSNFHSMAGKTNIVELASVIQLGDVFVGPVSSGMHLANVCRVPSVVIFGGYEAPSGLPYKGMIPFYTAVPCAPCWLNASCPYDIKCLRAITPEQVFAAVCQQAEHSTKAVSCSNA